jgi:chromosome segregation ATPase
MLNFSPNIRGSDEGLREKAKFYPSLSITMANLHCETSIKGFVELKFSQLSKEKERVGNQETEKGAKIQSHCSEFSTQISQISKEKEQIRRQIVEKEDEIETLRSEVSQISEEKELNQQSLNDRCESYVVQLDAAKHKLRDRDHKISDLSTQFEETESKNRELQKQLSFAQQESKNAVLSVEQAKESLLYAEDEIKRKERIIEQFSKSEEMMTSQRSDLSDEIERLRSELSAQKD